MKNQKRSLNEQLEDLKKSILGSSDAANYFEEIEFPDGTVIKADVRDFYDIVDMFASNYGLGGCKTLKEFIEHIDEIDLNILIGLQGSIIRRIEAMYGKKSSWKDHQIEGRKEMKVPEQFRPKQKNRIVAGPQEKIFIGKESSKAELQKMGMFLKSWGAPYDKVNEAINQIKKGKIAIPDEDFSWITPEVLLHPNFDTRLVLKAMRKSREKSINFNVGRDTLNARR